MSPLSIMGVGFLGGRYCQLYPEAFPEPRDRCFATHPDVLYTRSTVSNYNVLDPKTLKLDVDTNLSHLLDVLPNIRGTFNYTSSWFVAANAGQDPDAPAREDCPCDPNGLYSIAKMAAEKVVRSYTQTAQAGLVKGPHSYRVLRLCGVIGNDPKAGKQKNALEHMLTRLVLGEPVQVYTGDAFRDILHVDDVCSAINAVVTRGDLNTIYNVGRGTSVRMWDIVQYARERVGSKSEVTLIAPPRFHEIVQVDSFHMCVDKLRSLGWLPSMNIYESVDRVIAGIQAKERGAVT